MQPCLSGLSRDYNLGRMPAYRWVLERHGPTERALEEVSNDWLPNLFGGCLRKLASSSGECWGVVLLGPLEVALGFRLAARDEKRVEFELCHGPFRRFRYHAHLGDENGDTVPVSESLEVELPWFYGGTTATRWVVRRLLSCFEEIAP